MMGAASIEDRGSSLAPAPRGQAATVQDLVKTYPRLEGGTFNAADDVSFEVQGGEVFVFLGPNGAWKTTSSPPRKIKGGPPSGICPHRVRVVREVNDEMLQPGECQRCWS
jgi:ABC-type phosphonate transport system ATPase subunit